MLGVESIAIPEEVGFHNGLVEQIFQEGFIVPNVQEGVITRLFRIKRFRVGHIWVPEPKPDHPTSPNETPYPTPLPVGYVSYGRIMLVNTDKRAVKEYHDKLRSITDNFLFSPIP